MANVSSFVEPGMNMWKTGDKVTATLREAIRAGEPFRLKMCTRKGDYAAIPALFNVSCIWRFVGPVLSVGVDVRSCSCLMRHASCRAVCMYVRCVVCVCVCVCVCVRACVASPAT